MPEARDGADDVAKSRTLYDAGVIAGSSPAGIAMIFLKNLYFDARRGRKPGSAEPTATLFVLAEGQIAAPGVRYPRKQRPDVTGHMTPCITRRRVP